MYTIQHITRKAVTTATVLCIAALIAAVSSAFAADTVPLKMNYQARLKQSGAAYTGTQNMTFKIYDAATTGTVLWTETQTAVPFTNGLSSTVVLGSVTSLPATLFDNASVRYLEVTVGDTTLSPREVFYSVPYAFNANKLGGKQTATTNTADALYLSDSAGMLPANVVSSNTIVDGSITSVKIASAAISNAHISATARISPTKLDAGSVSIDSATFSYLSGATSNIQTQINTINTSLGTGPVVKTPSAEQVIQPTANVSPLVIKAYTGQTAALLTLKDSSGVSIASFSSAGNFSLGSGLTVDGVDVSAHAASSNSVHGLGSNSYMVGTTTTQTLTNKTLGDNCTWSGNAIPASKLDSTVARSTDVTTHATLYSGIHGIGDGDRIIGEQTTNTSMKNKTFHDASNHISAVVIDSGTLIDARLSSNVTKLGQTIEGSEITQRTIGTYNIAAGTITANEIAYKTIVATNIADGVITADKLYAGTIVSTSIATGAVAATNLADNAVTTDKIAGGSITAAKLGAGVIMLTTGAVTNTHIAENAAISPSKVYAEDATHTEVHISTAEFGRLQGVSSNIQTQLDSKVGVSPSAAQIIQPTADVTPLLVKAYSGQTAALFALKDASGVSIASFSSAGNFTLASGLTIDGVDISTHVAGSSGVHGLSTDDGYVVGTTKTQTLTNKTLGTGCTWSGTAISADSITGIVSTTTFASHTVATSTHGVFSDIVGSTDTQTLTNKTMDNSNRVDVRALYADPEADPRIYIADGLLASNILRTDTPNIPGTAIADSAISSRTLANASVYGRHLRTDDTIITGSGQIGNGIVVNLKLGDNSVNARVIQNGEVKADEIAEGVIYSTHIAAYQVKEVNIATGAVTAAKIAAGTLSADLIAPGAITDGHISVTAAISPAKLYANGVTISSTQFSYLYNVSSNIQTQLDGKVVFSPSAAQTIQPTTDVTPLSVKAYSGQTAALFAVKNVDGVSLASFSSVGNLTLASGLTVDGVDISAHAAASSGVHGLAAGSDVVGKSEVQTLTYKEMGTGCTWTGPNIAVSKITGALSSTDFESHRDTHIAHGVFSDVVGSTDTQTLTNKTITGATVNTPAINTATLTVSSMTTSTITATAIYTSVIGSNNSIDADAINSGTLAGSYIENNAITGNKIVVGVIYSTHIANSQVKTVNIDTAAITTAKIAASVIYSTQIVNYQVKAVNIDTDAVTTDKILADAVTLPKISPQIISGFVAKNNAGGEAYSFITQGVDGGTVTIRAGSNAQIAYTDSEIVISAVGGVASVVATDGLYQTESALNTYTFHVGTTTGGGVVVVGSSVTVDTSANFAPTWAGGHTFNAAPSFAKADGAPFTVATNTLVPNLNAQYLLGLSTGNSSGNIPFSNGTKCVNLNAEKVNDRVVDDTVGPDTSTLWTSAKSTQTFVKRAGDTISGIITFSTPFTMTTVTKIGSLNADMVDDAHVDNTAGPNNTTLWTSAKSTQTFLSRAGGIMTGTITGTDVALTYGISAATAAFTGNISMSGGATIDGRDVSTDGSNLDSVRSSTGTIAASTGTIQLQVTNIAASTGTIQLQVNSISLSTTTLVKKAGDTMTGALNMGGQLITGIGTKYSSFTATGLDMNTGYIQNIGVAGTDFTSTGGLTLADTLTVVPAADGNILHVKYNSDHPGFGIYRGAGAPENIYAFGAVINGEKEQILTSIHYYRLLAVSTDTYKAPLQTDSTGGSAFTFTAAKAGNVIVDFEQTNDRELRITNTNASSKRADLVLDDGYIKQYYTPTTSNNLLAGTTFYGIVVATAAPTGTGASQGSLYINPAADVVAANEILMGAAVGGTEKMKVDEDGDIWLAGAMTQEDATSTSTFKGGVKVESIFTCTKAPAAATTGFFLNPASDVPDTGIIFGIADNNNATQSMRVTGDGKVWIHNAEIDGMTYNGALTVSALTVSGGTLVGKISDGTNYLKLYKATSTSADGYYAVYAP